MEYRHKETDQSFTRAGANHIAAGAQSLPAVPVLRKPVDSPGQVPGQTEAGQDSLGEGDVVQLVSYMRAINGTDRIANEVSSLRREFVNETNRQHQVNTWVDGFAGMPTARHTGDDKHYYSPVGYKLEINNDEDVWANYRGDGNTNDIPVMQANWLPAALAMRTAVLAVDDYTAWADDEDNEYGRIPEVNADTNEATRSAYINYYLTPYLTANIAGEGEAAQARRAGQTAVRDAIKASGLAALRAHYGTRPAAGEPRDRFMGAGRNPEGMAAALENPDVRYIESIVHAKFGQVTEAWYNRHPGAYSEAAAQESWRPPAEGWLDNRRTAAEGIRDAVGAHNRAIPVRQIGPEPPVAE